MFSFNTGMIPNADVNIWVDTLSFAYSYWWANGPLRSDALGKFEARVPSSFLRILAFAKGFVQPCGATAAVWSDNPTEAAVRIEMQPISHFNSFSPARPQLSGEPFVTGIAYETTASGVAVIPGASIWAEDDLELGLATTVTDLGGRFYMCNLAFRTTLVISKEGFETRRFGPFDGAFDSWHFEIEMQRKSP